MALSRLAKIALFATGLLAAGAAAASTSPAAPIPAAIAPQPNNGDPGPSPCFWINQWQGWTAPGPDVILMKISNRYIYKVVLSAGSPMLQAPGVHLISLVQGTSSICNAIDLQLYVSDMHGFKEGLIARSLTKLTDDEVKTIPSKYLP